MATEREIPTCPLKMITPQIAVGYAPHSQSDIDTIKSAGIDAVLNLCAECYDLNEIESAAGFGVHWLSRPTRMRLTLTRPKRRLSGWTRFYRIAEKY
jgi:hypothetical protein